MEEFYKAAGQSLIFIVTIAGFAVFSGTFLWLIYDSLHALFPTAAAKGIIAKELGWWDSVCITWISSILIKSNLKK